MKKIFACAACVMLLCIFFPLSAAANGETQAAGEEVFTLSFVGDLTLGTDPHISGGPNSFPSMIGTDYSYPLQNVAEYFLEDDLTLGKFEGVLRSGGYIPKENGFSFKGDPAYTAILTQGGVDVVSLANNHSRDYGQRGLENTYSLLEEAGVPGILQNEYRVVETESGLKVGVLALLFQAQPKSVAAAVEAMRREDAELIVALIHWGVERSYHPSRTQEQLGKALIDAGVHIVCGSHPHVLQKIEEYGDGVIYYSLANFCFGGNRYPSDMDTAIIQQQVIRRADGTVSLGERTIIPACVSSQTPMNDFQPTPYPEGSESYNRVLSKLEGSFSGNPKQQTYPW